MECIRRHSLRNLNTFGIDVVADRYIRFDTENEIVDFIQRHPLKTATPLVLGGGSNLLFTGHVYNTVLHPRLKGIQIMEESGRQVRVRAMAGETWDDLVALAVARGWGGIENLSLIPGTVGGSAVQNIGAYGVEAQSVIECVEAIAMDTGKPALFTARECDFGYRTSRFKKTSGSRLIITAVVFRLNPHPRFVLNYPGVREAVEALGTVSLHSVRQAIINTRQLKLPDPAVLGNAGSFFKNPVVDRDTLQHLLTDHPDLPHYPQADGRGKLAAGWLIDRCGWKGRSLGRAAVHDRQALVLVNRGGATGMEILKLSERIRQSVCDTYGIDLEREVRVVGPVDSASV